jgi:signal transduction histidine kinase
LETKVDIVQLRVTDCAGKTLEGPLLREAQAPGPAGWAAIQLAGKTLGYVEVALDGRPERSTEIRLALACSVLGVLLGAGVLLFPRSVVRAAREQSSRMVQIQEEERGRIARELHDGLGQSLTALRLELELARGEAPEAKRLGLAVETCEEALRELKGSVYNLRPPELARGDLADALRACAERFEMRTGLGVSFRQIGPSVHSVEITGCLLRVLQEALTNVGRHAQATEVGVRLMVEAQEVRLEVQDDGRGFSLDEVKPGMGLPGLEERCAFQGGGAHVESRLGGGTRVVAWVTRGKER